MPIMQACLYVLIWREEASLLDASMAYSIRGNSGSNIGMVNMFVEVSQRILFEEKVG